MKILITGAAGFVGSNCVEFFAENPENRIIAIDNLSRHTFNLAFIKSFKNVRFYHVDLQDFDTLKSILKSETPDVILHLAGQVAVTTSLLDPYKDFCYNVLGTFNLLESIRQADLSPIFIFTSTNKVYGNNVNLIPIIEGETRFEFQGNKAVSEVMDIDHTLHTPYGLSKLTADLYVQEYGKLYSLKTYTLRMSCIYGIRQFGIEDQGWLAHFIWSALKKKTINIFGDGKQVRDVLYIEDLVGLFDLLILKSSKIPSTVFNVGGGPMNTVSLLELIEILEEILGREISLKFNPWREADQRVYISDITKVFRKIGWIPSIGVKEGVSKLIEWAKDSKFRTK